MQYDTVIYNNDEEEDISLAKDMQVGDLAIIKHADSGHWGDVLLRVGTTGNSTPFISLTHPGSVWPEDCSLNVCKLKRGKIVKLIIK